ncbi:unnamed protein product [Symbiodinium sp. KB8]|nr:unnamed protein product [Symbiodinium sp. KB8]
MQAAGHVRGAPHRFYDDKPPYANRGPPNDAALQERINNFTEVMGQLQADVWNLNEIEGCFMLNRLFNGSSPALPPVYSVAVGRSDDTGTGQHLGLLSRVPFTVSAPPFGTIILGGVHFKSAPNDPPSCAQREGQAQVFVNAVQAALDAVSGPAHVVVFGDFNDFSNAVPDVSGSQANSRVLEWVTRRLDLRAVAHTVPQDDRHTWGPSSSFPASQLDHMLVSPSLFRHLASVDIYRNASTFPSLSDHAPIIATFTQSANRAVPDLPSACAFLPFSPPSCGCAPAPACSPSAAPSPDASPSPPATPSASPSTSPAAPSGGSSGKGPDAGGVSPGATGGIAVGTFLVGLAVGWLVHMFCGPRRSGPPITKLPDTYQGMEASGGHQGRSSSTTRFDRVGLAQQA